MTGRRWRRWSMFGGAVLVGAALSALLASNPNYAPDATATQTMQRLMDTRQRLEAEQTQLQARLESLSESTSAYEQAMAVTSEAVREALSGARRTQIFAGQVDLHGPGIEVTLNDAAKENVHAGAPIALYIVHDTDVLKVINELRAAGAEAISINDVRLLSNSRVRCGGPTIHVKDKPLAPPFVIRAIGDPERLERQLKEGSSSDELSIYRELTLFGIGFTIKRQEDVLVKASLSPGHFVYAREGE